MASLWDSVVYSDTLSKQNYGYFIIVWVRKLFTSLTVILLLYSSFLSYKNYMRRTSSSFCLMRAFISKAPRSIPLSFFSFSKLYISSISCCFALKLSRSYSSSSSFLAIARFSSWILSRKLLSYWLCSFILPIPFQSIDCLLKDPREIDD